MKTWSLYWKKSKKPSKQRKYQTNSPYHIKSKFVQSHLPKELRKQYNRRSIRIRKGDKVKVMRGSFKGKIGEVTGVNVKNNRILIQGAEFTKKDGSKIMYPVHASNLMIYELILKDKKRVKQNKNDKKPS